MVECHGSQHKYWHYVGLGIRVFIVGCVDFQERGTSTGNLGQPQCSTRAELLRHPSLGAATVAVWFPSIVRTNHVQLLGLPRGNCLVAHIHIAVVAPHRQGTDDSAWVLRGVVEL